jgi:alkylation response protein AidB-like acyl-CoA dehydrogenase
MDLTYTKEYLEFEKKVEDFCLNYKDINIVNTPTEGSKKSISRAEWQNLLIENGYFARAIPKEYGGFGGEPDILKSRIIATQFAKHKIPSPMGGQGIDMLVPTLLELGTEDQKKQYIKPTLEGSMIWCQGYSEPSAGSDLAALQTKGELIDGKWVINGQKIWTSTAQYAHMMI